MPNRVLCPHCHGQRATSCLACTGTGKRSLAGSILGNCKECNGTGRRRCEVCGGTGEVEPANSGMAHSPVMGSAADEMVEQNSIRNAALLARFQHRKQTFDRDPDV